MRYALLLTAALTAATATAQLAGPGAVAWYPMEGNAQDYSGNGHDGTVDGPTLASGRFGQGYLFGATNHQIRSTAAVAMDASAGTIMMWVRRSSGGSGSDFLWDTFGGNDRRFILWFTTSNDTWQLYTDTAHRGISAAIPIPVGEWTHVALVWGANQLYVNGVLRHTFTAGGLGNGASTLYLGDRYTLNNFSITGTMDDVRVYNRALSSTDIRRVMLGFPPLGATP